MTHNFNCKTFSKFKHYCVTYGNQNSHAMCYVLTNIAFFKEGAGFESLLKSEIISVFVKKK